MAVGYQYQNEYNKKQESKGFKKKLVILVSGLLLLVIVAIVGAPKKDTPVVTNTPNTEIGNASKSIAKLDQTQKDSISRAKQEDADKFLNAIKEGSDIEEYVPLFLKKPLSDNPALSQNIKDYYNKDCALLKTDWPKEFLDNLLVITYRCDNNYLYLAAYRYYDFKFFNWTTSKKLDQSILVRKIGKGN